MKSTWVSAIALCATAVDAFRRSTGEASGRVAPAARAAGAFDERAERRAIPGSSARARGATIVADRAPANITDYNTVTTPGGFTIRYKEPGKAGVCETTPGVGSYSGYIDLGDDMHTFFWLFESRGDPSRDPMTLWLNGGPGSDSMIITDDLESVVNPYSWTNASNMLFLSQPLGVGFSYATEDDSSGRGRFGGANATLLDTTALAAVASWEVIQAFYSGLPQLDSQLTSKEFHFFTESYGGHYGPGFFDYFQDQNRAIANGSVTNGTLLALTSLGIGNGYISARLQTPLYPKFAVNNTYGIKAYPDDIYARALTNLNEDGGCMDLLDQCVATEPGTDDRRDACSDATDTCRAEVEGLYYQYANLNPYDIRSSGTTSAFSNNFLAYLNMARVQNAIGVNLNYTAASDFDVFAAFDVSGDWAYPDLLTDLERVIDSGVQVALYYGDADYICNWFGGEVISLAMNFSDAAQFRAAGYAPFMVDGVEYGEVRQYGNFSFTRIYNSGHTVPSFQPKASLALFTRAINLLDIATGETRVTDTTDTTGPASATHTEPSVLQTGVATPFPSDSSPGGMATQSSTTAAAPAGTSSSAASAGMVGTETPLMLGLFMQLIWMF